MGSGQGGGGEHGSAEREWESEDGVFPLDHFQGRAEIAQEGHGKIVRQKTTPSCWLQARVTSYFLSAETNRTYKQLRSTLPSSRLAMASYARAATLVELN